jgi:hydroxymethylbilane synthase
MIPATCQGIIGIEIRENDSRIANVMKAITHKETFIQAKAERKFLNTIEGGCQIPVGCYSTIDGDKFTITGYLSNLEATTVFIETAEGTVENSEKISGELAEKILSMGGDKIMNEIRNCN